MTGKGRLRARLQSSLHPSLFGIVDRFYRYAYDARLGFLSGLYKRQSIGHHSLVEKDVHGLGWRSIKIGNHVIICSRTVFNVNSPGHEITRISIDDWSFVGQNNFFSPGEIIAIGRYFLSGPGCRFLGADHVMTDPMLPYISSGIASKGVIRVGCNVWFGAGATVLGHVDIGHGSVIGANALVTGDVPPFSTVVGSPARVVRRYDVLSSTWIRADEFTADMAAALPNEVAYQAAIEQKTPYIHMPYRAAGFQRGDLA